MYAIEFSKAAVKVLTSMPRNTRDLIRSKIETLAVDPVGAGNVKKLVGRPGYRLRIGDWRVIYTLDSGRLVVLVLDIGARGGIYQ
jgi:mRNA interferase RelE/StbE